MPTSDEWIHGVAATGATPTDAAAGSVRQQPRPVTPASILAQLLALLVRQVEATGGLDASGRERLMQAQRLAAGLDPYLERCSTPESGPLRLLTERTRAHAWEGGALEQEMLSGHVEGQLLKMLVHATQAERVLEIGMFTGYSALAMAEALPANGTVVACELDADVVQFARRSFDQSPAGHKIEVRIGPAIETLDELAATGSVFDLVFIDADKAGYRDYLETVLVGSLLAPHGLICVDNTLMQGQPWNAGELTANGRAIAEFNQAVAADPRVEQVLIPLRDGITLIRLAGDR